MARLLVTAGLALQTGCVTGGGAVDTTAAAGNGRDTLTTSRREVARQIDAVARGEAAPNSASGLVMALVILGGTPTSSPMMSDYAAQSHRKALDDLHSKRAALDQEIDSKQCTVEARAKANTI